MAKKKEGSKKGKNRRVSKDKIAQYWNHNHTINMVLRARRIRKRFGQKEADRFVALHGEGCGHCRFILAARFMAS